MYHIEEFIAASVKANKSPIAASTVQNECTRQFNLFRLKATLYSHAGVCVERVQELALAAYKLTRSSDTLPTLRRLFEKATAERVFRQLRFIARIRAIHLTILDCLQALPNFGKIKITPIPHTKPTVAVKSSIDSARKGALRYLQTHLGSVPAWMNDPKFIVKLAEEYDAHPLIIHTEIRMACFFEDNKSWKPFPYIGISKKTCHLCSLFLSQLRTFQTRPSHGQLHPYWTLPDGIEVRKQKFHSLGMAFDEVRQKLAEMIGRSDTAKLAYLPESTAVWSARPGPSSASASIAPRRLPHLSETKQGQYRTLSLSMRALENCDKPLAYMHFEASDGSSLQNLASSLTEMIEANGEEKSYEVMKAKLDLLVGLLQVSLTNAPFGASF